MRDPFAARDLTALSIALVLTVFALFGAMDMLQGPAEIPPVDTHATCMQLHGDYQKCNEIQEDGQ